MTRPVPLAIISFIFGVLAVVMFIAPRHYTMEDVLFRNPQYAEHIIASASLVSNADIDLTVRFGEDSSAAPVLAASAPSVSVETVSAAAAPAVPAIASTAAESAADIPSGDLSVTASAYGSSLVIQLQNTGGAVAWGKLECRIGNLGWRIMVPVENLRPNMAEPALFVIPLGGIIISEEYMPIRLRWAKLYVK